MISQTSDYAIRAVEFLARHPDKFFTVDIVSAETTIPRDYLAKVMRLLARASIIESKRGLRGGFAISSEFLNYSVYDVINAIDPVQRVHHCPKEKSSRCEELCPLHAKLDLAIADFEIALRKIFIAEAAQKRIEQNQ